MTQFDTKAQALKAARQLRAKGQTVKVLLHSGVYCQPFVGLTSYHYYTVSAS